MILYTCENGKKTIGMEKTKKIMSKIKNEALNACMDIEKTVAFITQIEKERKIKNITKIRDIKDQSNMILDQSNMILVKYEKIKD